MKKILVSACLVGDKVRYDGKGKFVPNVHDLKEHFELVLVCPEFAALNKAPRLKMEVVNGRIIDEDGKDHTESLNTSIDEIVRLCKYLGITVAVLKARSPSCGNKEIYDGTFSKKLIDGQGLLVRALSKAGIFVYNEDETEQLLIDTGIIKIEEPETEEITD